ncbi:hypothetical protein CXG81DRAFT_23412 [Caulochytrium protostelioides]|uniref:Eukaryotic translation initiation factor 3 30 kDa subunit n=1 Tax=Caulochytrium protostelioides TaxID=1555241 RepID=A0A4V1IVG7_9FUNG|nr:hypothetical protein CXG81DRAFT_23412 [Caulochytrium protostelioides]|eukprot:RKP03999.1 hypothetical protein CXG81DRAFT_23412 [Caulochytrium protostelioides]
MSDWENENASPVLAVPATNAWDDEDAEEPVKESWEDSEDEKPAAAKTSSPATPVAPKKKKNFAQKAAEREEERRLAAQKAKEALAQQETPEQREQRLRQQQIDADIENARDLFGTTEEELAAAAALAASNNGIDGSEPRSRTEFVEFHTKVASKLNGLSDRPAFEFFAEDLARTLATCVTADHIRRLVQIMESVATEKRKATKAILGKKAAKSKKPAVKHSVKGGEDDLYADDKYAGEYDDFF